jgi:dUTP pyrophosphatase
MKIKLDAGAFIPVRAHDTDAGADLRSPIDAMVPARGSCVIDTGVHIQLPHGYVGMLKSKSGLNVKYGITSEGVIDEGYTGAIKVKLYNNSDEYHAIERGDKITQLVIVPCEYVRFEAVDELDDSERGDGGFGSTGK